MEEAVMHAPVRRRNRRVVVTPDPEPPLSEERQHNADPIYDEPDWRYRLAGMLARDERLAVKNGVTVERRHSRYLDTLLAKTILPFFERYRSLKTLEDRSRLSNDPKFEGLFWAMQTYEDALPIMRYKLEAAFVGGATPAQIAGAYGLEENYVWWYAKTFFDVHGRLQNKPWVVDKVLLAAIKAGTHNAKYNLLWKLIAGLAGWQYFVNANDHVLKPLTPDAATRITETVRFKAVEDACIAQLTRAINRFNAVSILEEHHRAEELDIRKRQADVDGLGDDSKQAVVSIVNNVVGALELRRADHTDIPTLEGPLASIYSMRDEMNAERARIAKAKDTRPVLADE